MYLKLYLTALAVTVVDQLSKYYVTERFALGESVPVIENIFYLTYILNPGAAFGMMEDSRWFFIAVAVAVLAGGWFFRREVLAGDAFLRYGAALFMGGAVGNVIDRARTGLVVDFFDFRVWPVFNVADIAICVGVGAVVWSLYNAEVLKR